MTAPHRLTLDQARRLAVRAQLLDAARAGDVVEVAQQLGAIKIDPTAVIAPAEHTILWSRIGYAYEPDQLKLAVERDRLLFEFDGAFRPAGLLPLMLPAMRRRPMRESTTRWLEGNERFRREVLARLRADGPLLASEIDDTAQVSRPPDGWSGTNQVPIMLDLLSRRGIVAISGREGRHRRWDLAERVYGEVPELDPDEAAGLLAERTLEAAGIAKQKSPWTRVGMAGEAATVEGRPQKYRVAPVAVAALLEQEGRDEDDGGRVAFLNPYDGMLFDRYRLREIFDFDYVLEQFKPKSERRYGLFSHPILMGDRFVGMLEAQVDRANGLLRIEAVHEFLPLDPEELEMIRAEISELAQWLGVEIAEGGPER